jgi:hypothetical protein
MRGRERKREKVVESQDFLSLFAKKYIETKHFTVLARGGLEFSNSS